MEKHKLPIFHMTQDMVRVARRARNDGEAPNKETVNELMHAFTEFKAANDENIKKRDVLLEAKIEKIGTVMDKFEPMNQQLTLASQQQKAMQEQLDQMQAIIQTPDLGGTSSKKDAIEFRAAFDRVMRKPPQDRDPKDVAYIQTRMAALVRGDDASAGYLLAPPEMQAEIIKDIVEMTPMRAIATVRTIGTGSLKQPKKTGTTTATRIGEVNTRTNTGDPTYGMVEIPAPEMFARIEVSLQMLEDSQYDLLGELREDAVEQFSVKEGYEYINGTGAPNQAEGILTNGSVGEVVSGLATAIKADAIHDLWAALKTGYGRNAVFGLNRSTISAIRKLKDGQGQYIWVPGIAGNVPNTIDGQNYIEMPDMPNIGAGAYPVVYGDFKRGYIIVDRIAIAFQVDYTTGADNGLVVFRARKRVGGGVRQADAIKKLKISA